MGSGRAQRRTSLTVPHSRDSRREGSVRRTATATDGSGRISSCCGEGKGRQGQGEVARQLQRRDRRADHMDGADKRHGGCGGVRSGSQGGRGRGELP